MGEAQRSLASFGRSLANVGAKLSVAVTLPLAALGGAAIRSATQLDSLKRGLIAVAGSASEADKQLDRLSEVAKLPGLGFQEAIQGSIRLQAAGFSATMAEDALKGFGNALATVGAGKTELDQVTRALSQIASKGKISAEEVNQLAEVVPQIRVVMKEAFGTANSEMLQKAGISAEQFVEKVTEALLKLPQVTGGPQNSFENLTDAMFRASAAIGEKLLPAVLPLAEGLATVLTHLRELDPDTVRWGIAVAGVAAALGPLTLAIGGLIAILPALAAGLTVVATALGVTLAPLLAVGGAVIVGLGLLSAWFVKNKLDALAAKDATDQWRGSLLKIAEMNRPALQTQENILKTMIRVGMQKGMSGSDLMSLHAELQKVQSRLATISNEGPKAVKTGVVEPLVIAATAAEKLSAALEKLRHRNAQLAITARPPTIGGVAVEEGSGAEAAAARRAQGQSRADFIRLGGRVTPVSVPSAPGGATEGPSGFSSILESAKGGFSDLATTITSKLTPAVIAGGAAFAVLKPVFDGFMSVIGPALSKLAAPLESVGRVLASIVVPILDALAEPLALLGKLIEILLEPLRASVQLILLSIKPGLAALGLVLKAVSWAFSFVNQAIGWFIEGLGKFIDHIVPNWISRAGKGLAEAGQKMQEDAKAMRSHTDKVEDSTDALAKFSSSVSNMPPIFDLALRRRMAALGSGVAAPGTGAAGSAGATGSMPGHRPPAPIGSVSGVTVNINNPPAGLNVDEVTRQVTRGITMGMRRGGTPELALALGSV